jgi:molybdenum cofactor cytidylyltransferase
VTEEGASGRAPSAPRAVILAAGASRRLGEPKALVVLGGRTALEHLVLAAGDGEAVLVIGGAHHEQLVPRLPAGAELIRNARWADGRSGSAALAASHWPGRDLLLAPVDVPLVPREVFAALRRAWAAAGAPARGWLAPGVRETVSESSALRPGHPVVIGRELARELTSLPPDTPLRELRGRATPRWLVEVQAREVLDDLDSPADLAALRARLRRPST